MTPQELSEAIQTLDKQLHEEVVSRHEDLLQQLSSLRGYRRRSGRRSAPASSPCKPPSRCVIPSGDTHC